MARWSFLWYPLRASEAETIGATALARGKRKLRWVDLGGSNSEQAPDSDSGFDLVKEQIVQNNSIFRILAQSRITGSRRSSIVAVAAIGTACWVLGGGLGADFQLTQTAGAQERPGGDDRGDRGDRGDREIVVIAVGNNEAWVVALRECATCRNNCKRISCDADISLFNEQLALDDAQQLVLETLFDDYEAAYEERSGEVQDQMRDLGRQMFSTMMSPEMREQMGERMRDIRTELDEIAAEQGDLSSDERRQLWRDRMQQIQEEMQASRSEQGLDLEMKSAMKEIFDLFEAWMVEKAAMRERFVTGVKSQLSDDQMAAWPSFERFLVREKSLPKSRLSGEGVNLFLAIDQYGLDDSSFERLEPLFDAYELALHESLVSRDRFLESSAPKLYKALQGGDPDEARRIVNRQVEYRKAVRDVNDQFIATFTSEVRQVDEESAFIISRELFARKPTSGYTGSLAPNVLSMPHSRWSFQRDIRSAVIELDAGYSNELDAMNSKIVNLVRKKEPTDQVAQVDRMASFLDGNFMGAWGRGGNDDVEDPVRDAYEKRGELDETYYERLVAMLTPEQVEQLPRSGRRDGGDRGNREDRGGSWSGGDFNLNDMPEHVRERMVERFDTDGDGELSETEIEQIRERFRGGGGRGGDGGSGGRGGQGGGPPV